MGPAMSREDMPTEEEMDQQHRAQLVSDEFGDGKRVIDVDITDSPIRALLHFEDETSVGVNGLIAYKIKNG